MRFGGVNKSNNDKCFTSSSWKQWWKAPNIFVKKRDTQGLKGLRSNKNGGGGSRWAFKRQALHVNDRPRPGFDYVDEEDVDDNKGNDTTNETLSANNNNNLTNINNGSEIVVNGTTYEGV